MDPNPQLIKFLSSYNGSIQALTLELRKYVTELVPEANELIWDNYNALAMAYSKSEKLKDAFCHISVYVKHVNFGFNRGAELSSKLVPLEGGGKLIRHIKVMNIDSFPKEVIEKVVYEAAGIADFMNPQLVEKANKGTSIVMSIAANKVRPNEKSRR